jgi:hypothetical protein
LNLNLLVGGAVVSGCAKLKSWLTLEMAMKFSFSLRGTAVAAALAISCATTTSAQAGILTGVDILNLTGITESSLTASNMTTARSLLVGAGANITDKAITSFSAADLTGIDILYVGLVNNGFTASQEAAINTYVAGGGGLVAVGTERACCFGPAWEEVANSFGLTGVGGDRAVKPTATTPTSPIVNGPFGVAASYAPAATGAFNLPLPAGATVVWEGIDNLPVIVTLNVTGRAFFFADTNFMENPYIAGGDNDIIWGNAFAFTGRVDPDPVPEPNVLVLFGLALAGLTVVRKRVRGSDNS